MTRTKLTHRLASLAGIGLLVAAMGGTWSPASAAPPWSPTRPAAGSPATTATPTSTSHAADVSDDPGHSPSKSAHRELTGKVNINTATEDQLMLLPTVGPAKAERIVTWRKKNGGFKRTADLRHVKGFGYKTFKRLEPFLDIKGDTTLVAQ